MPIWHLIWGIRVTHHKRPELKKDRTQIFIGNHQTTIDACAVGVKWTLASRVYNSCINRALLPYSTYEINLGEIKEIDKWIFSEEQKGLKVWVSGAGFTTKRGVVASFHKKFFQPGQHEIYIVRVDTQHAFSWAPRSLMVPDWLDWLVVYVLPYHKMTVHYHQMDVKEQWTQEQVNQYIGKDIFENIYVDKYITGWTSKKKRNIIENV